MITRKSEDCRHQVPNDAARNRGEENVLPSLFGKHIGSEGGRAGAANLLYSVVPVERYVD